MGWWQRYLRWRQRNVTSLALLADGFVRCGYRHHVNIRWDEVVRITTFKRDLMTTDLVCLAVETLSDVIEIDEEMPGYEEVEAEMTRRLGIGPEWKLRVMFPAFAPNIDLLYDRIPAAHTA